MKVHSGRFENLPVFSSSHGKNIENSTLQHFLLFEVCAREVRGKFVYKHSETIEHVKS